jgi:hypothetical protein
MAINFGLWAECKDEASTQLLARHFTGLERTLLNGRAIGCGVELLRPPVASLGLDVVLGGVSCWGVRTVQDVLEATEAGLHLYKHLKDAPAFRFARVGWQPASLTMDDLPDYVEESANGERRLLVECVIDEELYRRLRSPIFCYPFRDGYWWTLYRGESYRPLSSNDQGELNDLCRKLFPEYFKY